MEEKAKNVCASRDAEKQMMELGELLRRSDLRSSDRTAMAFRLYGIADELSSEGDERNAKAYLSALADEFKTPSVPTGNRMGSFV